MKYPPGTRVLLKSHEEIKEINQKLGSDNLFPCCVSRMIDFCGKVVTVSEEDDSRTYHFRIDGDVDVRSCGWRNEWVERKVDLEIDEDGNIL